jgi:hypothetical protein
LKYFAICLIVIFQGCSFLNPIFYEEGFKEYANKALGQDYRKYNKWGFKEVSKVVELNDTTMEYQLVHKFDTHATGTEYICHWAIIVNRDTHIIQSWRYISEPSLCKGTYFHVGAW